MRQQRSIRADDAEWAGWSKAARADGFESVAAWLRWLAAERMKGQGDEKVDISRR